MTLRIGSLFSGIGGLELGLERAGLGRHGLAGTRSGLWCEFSRIVETVCPQIVVVENVGKAWKEWVPVVRRDLGRVGYSSVPLRLSPAHLGFPHHRDRVFVVAYANGKGERLRSVYAEVARICADAGRPGEGVIKKARATLARNDGLPPSLARLPGNAVVPQVATVIGLAIKATWDDAS